MSMNRECPRLNSDRLRATGPLLMILGQVLGPVFIQLTFLVKVLATSMHSRPVIAQNKYGQYAPFGRRTALSGVRCRRRYMA
jgi:hypothetical protein